MFMPKPVYFFFAVGIVLIVAGCRTLPSEGDAKQNVEAAVSLTPTLKSPTHTPEPPAVVETSTQVVTASPSPTFTAEPELAAKTSPPTPRPAVPQEDAVVIAGNPDLDYAQVIFVRATRNSDGLWRFDTTVRHNDRGWDDYADAWQVVNPATGQVIAERILLHPHDNEQPFTRSQNGIVVPSDISKVIVRAKDNVEGFGGQEVIVDLSAAVKNEYYEVVR